MTESVNETQEQAAPSLQQEQVNMIRASLLQHVFDKYHILIQALKKLPIPQQIPGMHHAYLQIDGAMLWVKELINTAPLMLAPAPETTAGEADKVIESGNQESEETPEAA